ncbi:MAG: HAMP domain-containing histidine kinase [Lachnospiraceae bacterium]|nr:HAMP domain-containing histidine kinase [Lachnospiraceae bacterium]
MVRALQKKFILSAMIAVTLVMALFLAAMNLLNYYARQKEMEWDIEQIFAELITGENWKEGAGLSAKGDEESPGAAAESALENAADPADGVPGSLFGNAGPGDGKPPALPEGRRFFGLGRNDLSAEQFFAARVNADGDILLLDLSHVAQLDRDTASAYIETALSDGSGAGTIGGYYYRLRSNERDGTDLAFLDVRAERRNFVRTLLITLLTGAACWVLVLLLVIFLSKRAIRPIAENIEKQKRFVTDAGHELKTPIAIISANADALELYTGDSKWIRNIRSQTARLSSLTQNLLLLSRMEEGSAVNRTAPSYNAADVFRETAAAFGELFDARNIRYTVAVPEEEVCIRTEKEAYIRLIQIFLENASKYAKDGGFTEASLVRESGNAVCIFRNDCREELTGDPMRLFDRFFRADEARARSTGGSGIGLAAARAIAEGSHGTVAASYERDPDSGLLTVICFKASLPLK